MKNENRRKATLLEILELTDRVICTEKEYNKITKDLDKQQGIVVTQVGGDTYIVEREEE